MRKRQTRISAEEGGRDPLFSHARVAAGAPVSAVDSSLALLQESELGWATGRDLHR